MTAIWQLPMLGRAGSLQPLQLVGYVCSVAAKQLRNGVGGRLGPVSECQQRLALGALG